MNRNFPVLLYFSILVASSAATLVKFQDGLEYIYSYEGTTHLHNVANFTVKGQMSVLPLNESSSDKQTCCLNILSFKMIIKNHKQEHTPNINFDFNKWFSFDVTSSGEVTGIHYEKNENAFVVIIKKTLLGALSSRLHTTPQTLKSGNIWSYRINETSHDGENEVSYKAQKDGDKIIFQRSKRSTPVVNANSQHDKEIHYHTELGIPHTIRSKEYFAGPSSAPSSFKAHHGHPNEDTKIDRTHEDKNLRVPRLSGSAETFVKFVETRVPRQIVRKRKGKGFKTDTLKVPTLPPVYVPLKYVNDDIASNLTCMRTVRPLYDAARIKCFKNIVALMRLLSAEDLRHVTDTYLRSDFTSTADKENRLAIADALGTLDSTLAQIILTNQILKSDDPDYILISRTLTNFIILRNHPPQILLSWLEKKALEEPYHLPDEQQTREINSRVILVLGAMIKEMEKYDPEWCIRIIQRLHDKLGLFDTYHHRRLRDTESEDKVDDFLENKANLLLALGNAGSSDSFPYFQSYVNSSQVPSYLRRNALKAISTLHNTEAVDTVLVTALTDEDEHVRHEAKVLYRQHPAALPVTFTDYGAEPRFTNMSASAVSRAEERWQGIQEFVRKIFQGFQFKLNIPGLDWRKQLGSSDIGASFGITMKNTLEINIKPLEGFLNADFYDTAYVTGHLGILDLNVNIVKGEVCFKGGIEYNFNILQELGLKDIKDLVFLYDKIVRQVIGRIKNATIRFNDLVGGFSEINLKEMVDNLVENFKTMPYTIHDLRKLAEKLIAQVSKFSDSAPPVFLAIRNLVVRVTTFYNDVKKDIMGFYNAVAELIQVIIPWAAEQIQKAVEVIIRGIKLLFKDPKAAIENITKGIARIQAAVTAIIQAKDKVRKTFLYQDKPPYWLDLGTELKKMWEDVKKIKQAFNATWIWVKQGVNSSHPMEHFTSANVSEVKRLLYDEMKDVIDDLIKPFKPLEVLAKPFMKSFDMFSNLIIDIKNTYNELKAAYTKTKSVIEKIFGPRFQKKFPRTYLKPDSSCGVGFYPSKGKDNWYKIPGVMLEVHAGDNISMPMHGTVVRDGKNRIKIITSELKNVEIIISHIQIPYSNEDKELFRGQLLGYAVANPHCSEDHIHVAMRSTLKEDEYIEPTRYLERRDIPPPRWNQKCNDYKLSVFDKIISQGKLTERPKKKEASPERKDPPDVSDLPPVTQARFAFLDKLTDYAQNFSDFIGFNISSFGTHFNFTMNDVKVGDAIEFLKLINETESTIKHLESVLIKLKIEEANMKNKCLKPKVMTTEELKDLLKQQNKDTNGTKDLLIKQLHTLGDVCKGLSDRIAQLNQNIYCTFADSCLGVSCCMDVKLYFLEFSVRSFVSVNPCTLNLTLGFYNWSKEISIVKHNFAKQLSIPVGMPEKLQTVFDQGYLLVNFSISKLNNNLTISLDVILCSNKTDECQVLKSILDKIYIIIPGCKDKPGESGIASYKDTLKLTGNVDTSDLKQLTFKELEVRIERSKISTKVVTQLLNELREIHEAVVKFYIDTALDSFMNPNKFSMHDICMTAFPHQYTKEQKFFEYQYTVILGFFPVGFAFGAFGNWGVAFKTDLCLMTFKATSVLTPQVGAHVYGALQIGFVLFGEVMLSGYLLTTSFPITGQIVFNKFPFDVGARLDLVLVPLRLELHGLLTFAIGALGIREVLFDALIWEYSTPSLTANIFTLNDLKRDETPPKFFVYRPKKVEWKKPGGKEKRAIDEKLNLPDRSATSYCHVEQLKNRDYTDPAYLLEMEVDDDESETTMTYCAGTFSGGCDITKDEPLAGASTIIPTIQGGGFPLYFTVTAKNSNGNTADAICNLTSYDVTPPTGRITPIFFTTSNPRVLGAAAAIIDESPVIKKKMSVGFGKASYGDQIIPWTELETTATRISATTDYETFFSDGRKGRIVSTPIKDKISTDSINECARECFYVPDQKCLSFNLDKVAKICELLGVVENRHTTLNKYKNFYNYERLIVGQTLEFLYDDLDLKHNNLYYFNMYLENELGYKNIISSLPVMADFTIPEPGVINNIKEDRKEKVPCDRISIADWSSRCYQGDSPFDNHRLIKDGEGSKTVFNGKELLVDTLYQRAQTFIAVNWDGIHDPESGILGYAFAVGTEPCSTNIYPYTNPHKTESESAFIGIAHPLQLQDGKYYVTVRAYNNIEYGGPKALTVCHTTPITIDNTPPIVEFVGDPSYNEETEEISIVFSVRDDESKIKGIEMAIGKSLHDNLILDWTLAEMIDDTHSKLKFKMPDGVSAWVKIRAINNVDMKTAGHAKSAILVDTSPPLPGFVYDGEEIGVDIKYQSIADKICTNWGNFQDPESGISHYMWGVGTRPGSDDTLSFNRHKKTEDHACSRVHALKHGTKYYSTIIAFNEGHNQKSISVSSSGVIYDKTPPVQGWAKDGLDPNQEKRFSSEPASVFVNWDNFIDQESDISGYSVSVFKDANVNGAHQSQPLATDKSVSKDLKSLSWHNFHHAHLDHVKVKVDSINGAGLSSHVFTDGFTVDLTYPKLVFIGDGERPREDSKYTSSKTQLSANWLFEDKESGIDHYKIQIFEIQPTIKIQIYPAENEWKDVQSGERGWKTTQPLSLIDGRTYIVRVMGINGGGLTAVVDSGGVIVDSTPPTMELVKVGVPIEESEDVYDGFIHYADTDKILASWRGRDAESGIKEYIIGVGDRPDYPNIATMRSKENYGYIEGLSLTHYDANTKGPIYYVIVRAVNEADLQSEVLASRPIKVLRGDQAGIVTDGPEYEIVDAKTIGIDIDYQFDYMTVTAVFQGFESQQHGIVSYEWAVGTEPRLDNIKSFSASGIVVDNVENNPGDGIAGGGRAQDIVFLEADKDITYYITVHAITGANNKIESSSNGFRVVTSKPHTIFTSLGADFENTSTPLDSSHSVYQSSTEFITASWEYHSVSDIQYAGYLVGTFPGSDDIVHVRDSTEKTDIRNDQIQPKLNGLPNIITVATANKVGFWHWTSSASIVADNTPPILGKLVCPEYAHKFSSITCSWSKFYDPESGIDHFIFGVGIRENDDTIHEFTRLPWNVFSYTTSDFKLPITTEHISHYFVTLGIVNKASVQANAYASLFIDTTSPVGGRVVVLSDRLDAENAIDYSNPISCNKINCDSINAICQKSLTQIAVAWEIFTDPDSPIVSYEVAAGTTPGGSQLKYFTKIPNGVYNIIVDGLDLTEVEKVFITIKGTNAAGLSNVSISQGVFISKMSAGLPPLGHSYVYDGNVIGTDLDLQDQSNTIAANWLFHSDSCPIKKYEWSIIGMNGNIIQPMIEIAADKPFAQNDEIKIPDESTVYVVVRATNLLDYTYTARSNGITISIEPLLPGIVRDGNVAGKDINYQKSIASLSANWDNFGTVIKGDHIERQQLVHHYEVSAGTDPRYARTRSNIHPFINVGLNRTWTFNNLLLSPKKYVYYVTVRAYSVSSSMTEVTSNGVRVGYGGKGVTKGHAHFPRYLADLHNLAFSWHHFESEMEILWNVWGMSSKDIEKYELSCHELQSFDASYTGTQRRLREIFDIQHLTNIGKDTAAQRNDLNLDDKGTYSIIIMATDEAGECAHIIEKVTVDLSPPHHGKIKVGAFYDTPVMYISYPTFLTVDWTDFVDDESGISKYQLAIFEGDVCRVDHSTGNKKIVDFIDVSPNQTSHTFFFDSDLPKEKPYYIHLKATNKAGLSVSDVSPPIILDEGDPLVGDVKDGADIEDDLTHQSKTDHLSASFMHLPNAKIEACSSKYEKIPGVSKDWEKIIQKGLYGLLNLNIRYNARQVYSGPDSLTISMIRDTQDKRMLTGATHTHVEVDSGSHYKISIKAAPGSYSAVTSVTLWDGPPDNIGDLDFKLDITTVHRPIALPRRIMTEEEIYSIDLEDITFRACGLQLHPDVLHEGNFYHYAVLWCNFANKTSEAISEAALLPFNPADDFHTYTLIFKKEKLSAIQEDWSLELKVNNTLSMLILTGIPVLSKNTQFVMHVWNRDNFIPDITDRFSLPTASAYFKDLHLPGAINCRYAQPFINSKYPIIGFFAGIGSARGLDNIEPYHLVKTPCVPCLNPCDVYICDTHCDSRKITTFTVELKNLKLNSFMEYIEDGEKKSVPALYYFNIKAVSGSGRAVIGSSNGIYIDVSPPVFNYTYAVDEDWSHDRPTLYQGSSKTISAQWAAYDYESEVKEYLWAIGTNPHSYDIQPFVSVGLELEGRNDDLDGILHDRTTYYISVKAINGADLETLVEINVTVRYSDPDIDGIHTIVQGQTCSEQEIFSMCEGDDSLAVSWTEIKDEAVNGLFFSVGTSHDRTSVIPERQVGVRSRGSVNIRDGQMFVNNILFANISGLYTGLTPDYVYFNHFLLEPGKFVQIYLKACTAAHKCKDIHVKPVVIGDRHFLHDVRTRVQNAEATFDIALETRNNHAKVMANTLDEQTLRKYYSSSASEHYNPYIVDPEQTRSKIPKPFKQRLDWMGSSFFVTVPGKESYSINIQINSGKRDASLLYWNVDTLKWEEAKMTCPNSNPQSDNLHIKVCPKNEATQFSLASLKARQVNNPPALFGSLQVSAHEDAPFCMKLRAHDPDGDDVIFELPGGISSTQLGTVTLDIRGRLCYTPCQDCHGTDILEFVVKEDTDLSDALSTHGRLTINLTPVSDAPEILFLINGKVIIPNNKGEVWTYYDTKEQLLKMVVMTHDVDKRDVIRLDFNQPRRYGQYTKGTHIQNVHFRPNTCTRQQTTVRDVWHTIIQQPNAQQLTLPYPCDLATSIPNLEKLKWTVQTVEYSGHYDRAVDEIQIVAVDPRSQSHPAYLFLSMWDRCTCFVHGDVCTESDCSRLSQCRC